MTPRRSPHGLRGFGRNRAGTAALEFSLVAMPFIMLLLGLPQMAVYYLTQTALDGAVIKTADALVNSYYTNNTPTTPTAAALKTQVVNNAGALIRNDATLSVDLRKLSNLGSAVVAIGNTVDSNVAKDILVLRAKATVATFVPFMGTLSVQSSALVRRQAL